MKYNLRLYCMLSHFKNENFLTKYFSFILLCTGLSTVCIYMYMSNPFKLVLYGAVWQYFVNAREPRDTWIVNIRAFFFMQQHWQYNTT